LAVCPVGAITNKYSKYLYKPWQMKKTTTTCNYCGDGCQMHLETKDTEVVRVTSPLSWKNKWGDRTETAKGHGGLCVRGRFGFQYIDSEQRLRQPLVRTGETLTETPWLDTMQTVIDRLSDIHRKHGPESIAGLITARCTNEELYLFQKLMRAGLRTNQLDSSARYGHLNYVHAVRQAVGVGRPLNDWEDLTKAKAILVIGSNITETNPLTAVRIKEAIRVYRSQVIVVDSANTNIAQLASHPLLVKPGSESFLIDGLVKSVIEQDLVDEATTARHPQAFAALKEAMAQVSLDHISAQTGISAEQIREVAAIFAEAPRAIALCAEGIVRQPNGYHNVLKLIDLAWVTGKLGQPAAVSPPSQKKLMNRVQWTWELRRNSSPDRHDSMTRRARERFGKAWDVTLPASASGANFLEILARIRNGQIKALYVIGENPLATLPASMDVKGTLEKLQLLIVQDPFLTETGKMAHVVLPAATYAEKEGTFTNLEGKVLRVRQAVDQVGESLPDWHIMTALANGLGYDWTYESPQDVQNEIMKLLPGYYNLGQPRRVSPSADAYLSNGYAAEVASRYRNHTAQSTPNDGTQPFTLLTGQVLYHSGKMSTRASGLINIEPNNGRIRMNPADVERLGLNEQSTIRLTSRQGSVQAGVKADPDIQPGSCFFPEHFNEPP
jgi:formate dehydrogenase alpha subunit